MRIILTLFLVSFIYTLSWASQASQIKEANQFFKEKKWDESIDRYFNALEQGKNENIVHYDLGTAFYKKGDFDQSIDHLQKAITPKDERLNSLAYYNLGNSLFRKGMTLEKDNLDQAIESMKKSLDSYEKSLKLNPKDEDALYNQKVVEEEIKRLEKKKQEQSSKQQNQKNQNKDQSQQNQKQDQKSDKGDKSSKEEEQNQSTKEDQQKSKDQKNDKGQTQSQEKPREQQDQSAGQSQEELQKKQAQDILKDYERDEAPKGLLNFMKFRKGEDHVDRDW